MLYVLCMHSWMYLSILAVMYDSMYVLKYVHSMYVCTYIPASSLYVSKSL